MQLNSTVPIIKGAVKKLDNLDRTSLLSVYDQYRTASNEWLRRQIVENNRIDILSKVVLGYEVMPFHFAMMKWQFMHPESLILSFRGGGKSTTGTVVRAIYYLCKNRNFTIVIGSESKSNSAGFLREIKGHLESNERLIEIFGPFYDPRLTSKWDSHEIDVLGKTRVCKESSIMCTGVDAAITSKHFDAALYDDLAVEDNSRTPAMREKIKTWYYKTWTPLISPPDPDIQHRGEHHGLGTRQHPEDLYGHLNENELKGKVLRVPALDEYDNSPWPEIYPPEFFKSQRRKMGIILFGAQYQQDVEAMKGEVFQYDDCIQLSDKDWPEHKTLKIYMGTDLAVGEKDKDCMFAISVIGIKGSITKRDCYVYLLDYYLEHLRASEQEAKIVEYYDKWKPLRVGLETNQYQDILRQNLKKNCPSMVVKKVNQKLDKVTRAQKLSWLFEAKRAFFLDSGRHGRPIDHLVRFPSDRFTKDFFDSYDNAFTAAKKKGKVRSKRKSFGIL